MAVNNSTNRYAVANFIVAPTIQEGANYTSIAAAIADASSGDTIFIKPGTYTEDLTLKAGVYLTAFNTDGTGNNVNINGKLTANYTSGCQISGISLRTNGDNFLEATGSTTTNIRFINCRLTALDATGIDIDNANFTARCEDCILTGSSGNLIFDITSIGSIEFTQSTLSGGTGVNLIDDGAAVFFNSRVSGTTITTAATGRINCFNTQWDNGQSNQPILTMVGTNTNIIANSQFFTGTAQSFSI